MQPAAARSDSVAYGIDTIEQARDAQQHVKYQGNVQRSLLREREHDAHCGSGLLVVDDVERDLQGCECQHDVGRPIDEIESWVHGTLAKRVLADLVLVPFFDLAIEPPGKRGLPAFRAKLESPVG